MAAYCRVYDSRHLQADCQKPGSAPEPYAQQSSVGYLLHVCRNSQKERMLTRHLLKATRQQAVWTGLHDELTQRPTGGLYRA